MDLKDKRFLVIGGAGLIGSHTVDQLLKHDVKEVVIFDNFARGKIDNIQAALNDPRCRVFDDGGDITEPELLNRAMVGIDGVFHFAALWLLQCHEYPRYAFNVNVGGTFNVMQACVDAGVERLVYSSSASVYGDALTEPIDEEHPFNNKNFYGATKICGESLLRAFHHRYSLPYVGLRYMNVYGPRQDYLGAYIAVMMRMLDNIDRGVNPEIFGDGSESFDFVAVEDCAQANIRAMESEVVDRFYNVGTGVKTSLLTVAHELLDLSDSKLAVDFRERSQATLVRNRVGSTVAARRDLGFESSIDLREGLRRLIHWRNVAKIAERK